MNVGDTFSVDPIFDVDGVVQRYVISECGFAPRAIVTIADAEPLWRREETLALFSRAPELACVLLELLDDWSTLTREGFNAGDPAIVALDKRVRSILKSVE